MPETTEIHPNKVVFVDMFVEEKITEADKTRSTIMLAMTTNERMLYAYAVFNFFF